MANAAAARLGGSDEARQQLLPGPPRVVEDEVANLRRMARYYFPGRESILVPGGDVSSDSGSDLGSPGGGRRSTAAAAAHGGGPGLRKPRQLCVGRISPARATAARRSPRAAADPNLCVARR